MKDYLQPCETSQLHLTFIYKIPHGYFPGAAFFRYAPTVNSSAWNANNLLVKIAPMQPRFPCFLSKRRSEEGKRIRRQYKNDKGVPYQACKAYQLNQSGVCDCITTFTSDNNIIELTNNHINMEYHEHPTKEDLLEYFGQRIRIRKMTENESFRLMSVDDADIEKIRAYPFKSYAQRKDAIAKATVNNDKKELLRVKRESICKTACYRLAGNSIVTDCLYWIFYKMFIDTSNQNQQPSLFDAYEK